MTRSALLETPRSAILPAMPRPHKRRRSLSSARRTSGRNGGRPEAERHSPPSIPPRTAGRRRSQRNVGCRSSLRTALHRHSSSTPPRRARSRAYCSSPTARRRGRGARSSTLPSARRSNRARSTGMSFGSRRATASVAWRCPSTALPARRCRRTERRTSSRSRSRNPWRRTSCISADTPPRRRGDARGRGASSRRCSASAIRDGRGRASCVSLATLGARAFLPVRARHRRAPPRARRRFRLALRDHPDPEVNR